MSWQTRRACRSLLGLSCLMAHGWRMCTRISSCAAPRVLEFWRAENLKTRIESTSGSAVNLLLFQERTMTCQKCIKLEMWFLLQGRRPASAFSTCQKLEVTSICINYDHFAHFDHTDCLDSLRLYPPSDIPKAALNSCSSLAADCLVLKAAAAVADVGGPCEASLDDLDWA